MGTDRVFYVDHTHRRVSKFRADYAELRSQFEKYKEEAAAAVRHIVPALLTFNLTCSLTFYISSRMLRLREQSSSPVRLLSPRRQMLEDGSRPPTLPATQHCTLA